MCERCESLVSQAWEVLKIGQEYSTPDKLNGALFSIDAIEGARLHISPQNLSINKDAFVATVHYLLENSHYQNKPCRISSSNDLNKAGPLCIASRHKNNGVRCINYIAPILECNEILTVDGNRPNRVWLNEV